MKTKNNTGWFQIWGRIPLKPIAQFSAPGGGRQSAELLLQ